MKNFTKNMLHSNFGYPLRWLSSVIVLVALSMSTVANAQTATLGSGTAVSVANSGNGLGPVNSYYAFMHYQVVYTAAEITAAGGATGLVSQFGWNVSTPSAVVLPNYKIRMAQTTATNSATHNAAALTEVYSGNYTSTEGYNMFSLTSPFVWDGTSNILVDVCYGEVEFEDPYGQVFVYGTDADSSRFARSDGSTRCETNTDIANAFKPQARFVFITPPSCFAPVNITASALSSTSISVNWTGVGTAPAGGYEYYHSATNTAPTAQTTASGSVATGTSSQITGLPVFTTQYIWVRAKCGDANFSAWSGPVSTSTMPSPATLPYTEDFESANPQFSISNGTQTNKWVIGNATSNGTGSTRSLYISDDNGVTNDYTLTAPSVVHAFRDVTLPADIVQANISFDFRGRGESTYDFVRIWAVPTNYLPTAGTLITPTNSVTGVNLVNIINLREAYTRLSYDIPASAYAGQTIRLVFEWQNDDSAGTNPPAAIDNLSVTTVACFAPTAVTATAVPGSATFSWTAPATAPASGYDYYYSTTNTAPTAATEALGNVPTGTTVTLTTLSPDTVYYLWVRSKCGDTNTSLWVSGGSFRTECPASVPSSAFETFATYNGSANSPLCWKEATGSLTATPPVVALGGSGWTNENYGNATGNNGLAARVELYGTRNEWIISPSIDLGNGTTDYQLEYDAVVVPWTGTAAVTAMGEKYVNVVISTDGGLTWSAANIVKTYDNANIPATSRVETIQLEGYTGIVKIGFYAFSSTTTQDLRFYIDNFRVREVPSCLNPVSPILVAGSITETTAQISWTAPTTAPANGYQYYASPVNTAPTAATTETGSVVAGVLTATVGSLTPNTVNYVWVRSNCGNSQSEWVGPVSFRTLCDAPDSVTANGTTICGIGTATLTATATSGTISWYAAATGGAPLNTGASFVTPQLTATTTYYVSANNIAAATAGGAKVTPTPADGGTTASNYGLVFNATSEFTLNSVDVFLNSTTAGNVVVVLQNSTGAQLQTATIAVPAGNATTPVPFTLNLGWNIPVGTGFRILAVSGPSMLREYSAAFPYAVGGSANVTSGYAFGGTSGTYYYFYNWNYTGVCATPRVAVVATVTTAPPITVTATAPAVCIGGSTTLNVASDNAGYDYVWTPGNLEGPSQIVTPTATTEYTVTATDEATGCVSVQTVTVTVNALPEAIAVTPQASVVCANTVQALAVTGAEIRVTGTVGTATTQTGGTDDLTAFSNRRSTYKSQTIYTAAELRAAGLQAGNIYSIAYNISTIGDAASNANYTVKIGTTANVSFADTNYVSETGFTTVFAPATYTHAVGLNTITFTTPYNWDGVSNIVISVSHSGIDSINNARTYYTATTANTTLYNFNNLTATTGTASALRFNVTFTGTAVNAVTWSPVTNLYTDAAATTPYTQGTAATTVYVKSDVAATTAYTVTSTTAAGCSVTTGTSVTVTTTAGPAAEATQTFCGQGVVGGLEATGTAIQWYADATGGNPLAADVALANGGVYYASQTIDGCSSTVRTPVTVEITAVAVDAPADVVTCTTYVLPALTNGSYYTATNGGGNMLPTGTPITETTTLFVYATGATPDCFDQNTFTVTIAPTAAPAGISPQTITAATAAEATIESIEVTATGTVTWYASQEDALAGTGALAAGTQVTAGSTYYATQTIDNCISTTVLAVTIEAVLGDKGFDASSFSYYPNPVSNVLNLSYSSEITSVAVFNLVGQQVIAQHPKATTAKLDTSLLAEGTYLVRVTAGSAVKTIKIVKKGN